MEKLDFNYLNQLRTFIYKRVNDVDDTNDIIQEVFLKINDNLRGLKDEEKLSSWIFSIARNEVTNYFRARKNIIKGELIVSMLDQPELESNLNERVSKCLAAFIMKLPYKYQYPLILCEIEGKNQKEISTTLGISYSGTKSRIQRGREKLKEMLLKCCSWELDCYGNVLSYTNKSSCCKPC